MRTSRILLVIGIAVVLAAAGFALARFFAVPTQETYTNATYGYSFAYPSNEEIDAYTPADVAVGQKQGDGFDASAEVVVDTADAADTYKTFDDFLYHEAEISCDADGPTGSIRCPSTAASSTFLAANGMSGEVFFLNEMTTDASGTISTAVRGPYAAFELSSSSRPFEALIIEPALNVDPADVDTYLIEQIANSVAIATSS